MFLSVFRKVVWFPALLQRKKVFFQFAASPPEFPLKARFCFCLAKLRCSRILLLRTTFPSSFVSKLHFWRSILPKKCFGLLATKIGCFEPYVTKNSVFPLHRKKVLSQFASSHADFYLTLLKTTFLSLSGLVTLFSTFCFWEQAFLSFVPKLHFWPFILLKLSFDLVATKLEASSFMSQKAAI